MIYHGSHAAESQSHDSSHKKVSNSLLKINRYHYQKLNEFIYIYKAEVNTAKTVIYCNNVASQTNFKRFIN